MILAVPFIFLASLIIFFLKYRNARELKTGTGKRTYLIHVPAGYPSEKPMPLVISIHGFVQWPDNQKDMTRWNDLADEEGFIVVYPTGSGFPLRWRTLGRDGQVASSIPDVVFISDLIDHIRSTHNIDPKRIYVNGMSNGGAMSFVLACALSDRIAAFASVAGDYQTMPDKCHFTRPVPAIIFHGVEDLLVPYHGRKNFVSYHSFFDVPGWVQRLAKVYGCTDSPELVEDNEKVRAVKYGNGSADVVFYSLEHGGHTWPGGKPLPGWIAGYTEPGVDATRIMWEFFSQHPLT